jgi:hypothetical protein
MDTCARITWSHPDQTACVGCWTRRWPAASNSWWPRPPRASRRRFARRWTPWFGAERLGNVRMLARTQLLRHLRARRRSGAYSGEVDRRERLITALRRGRISGIRVPVAANVMSLMSTCTQIVDLAAK